MNQLLLFSCLLIISTVAGAPSGADDQKSVPVKPFQAQDCSLPIEEESDYKCRALHPRYKWSVSDNDCVDAFYGGCRPTRNNFVTKEECLKVAKPVCLKK
ncbi:kappaPI-actitoxin-Avd3c-like isoform X2 [Diorhabda carinulata]|uniref:kappaPI-actitoxin-Avd3c-like isoform X2 n=1 Tax=Diorhabda carinulata TaxID=1163345 RepID=UPI0025A0EC84|nr:kappaPI-actitoxin-Avd3c-like isoform X2 [Diorhabda carinulata]